MRLTTTLFVFMVVVSEITCMAVQAQRVKQDITPVVKPKKVFVTGKVQDQNKEGVGGLTVTATAAHITKRTDPDGSFILGRVPANTRLVVKYNDQILCDVPLGNRTDVIITVIMPITTATNWESLSTGYQQFSSIRNTGSNFSVSQDAFQKRVTRSLVPRLEGLVPGLLPVTNKSQTFNQPTYFSIGGKTTLIASPDPLIVVNDFPYLGPLSSINPDDVEDITVLRDAAAIGVWGARASNGVVVIKTRSAKYIPRFRVSFNAYIGWGGKPDLYYEDRMSSPDRIFVDTALFRTGYFDRLEKSRTRPALSPVVEALYDKSLTAAERLAFLDSLSKIDNRHDLLHYFYRPSFRQHFSTQFSAGSELSNIYFSLGYDNALPEVQLSREQRKTAMLHVNMRPHRRGIELSAGVSVTEDLHHNLDGIPDIPQPYELLVNKDGSAASVPYKLRYAYIDTAGRGQLLDWRYYPLNEFRLRNNTLKQTDIRYDAALKYSNFPGLLKGLETGFFIQQQLTTSQQSDIYNGESFTVRDLVNSYSEVNGSELIRPIPAGDIADFNSATYTTLNMRFKLLYAKKVGADSLTVMAGSDRNITKGDLSTRRIYNYGDTYPVGQSNIDFSQTYPMYYFPALRVPIPNQENGRSLYQNYYSTYLHAIFLWKQRYDFYASLRRDRSNLYGALINYKNVPLFSAGMGWQLSAEQFYHSTWLPFVKLRATYGQSGNSPYKAIAAQTLSYNGYNGNGDPVASYNTPPLPSLRWEKLQSINLGFNVRTANDRVELSMDWYRKSGTELIGYRPLDITSGIYFLTGNVAATESRNIDFILESKNIMRTFQWRTSFLLSYIKDYVKHSDDTLQAAWVYCDPTHFTTVVGKPLNSVFSFAYKGLDNKGNPLGNSLTDYSTMVNEAGSSSLVYNGRATPGVFGSMLNDFEWKQFNLSVMLTGKFNYYFRKQSINYYNLYNGTSQGSSDFKNRWQQPGDEKHTNVPSMPVTANPDPNRDFFYNYSDVLVARGDHIRLQNLHLGYDLNLKALKKLQLRMANIYFNCSNIGIIWKANHWGIDPDKLTGYPQPVQYAIGFRGTFK